MISNDRSLDVTVPMISNDSPLDVTVPMISNDRSLDNTGQMRVLYTSQFQGQFFSHYSSNNRRYSLNDSPLDIAVPIIGATV